MWLCASININININISTSTSSIDQVSVMRPFRKGR